MKVFLLLPLALLLRTGGCDQPSAPKETGQQDCRDVICTEVFAMVTVQVTGADRQAAFDEVYTLRVSTGEKIRPEQGGQGGTYVVLDDSYREKLVHRQDTFRFIAVRNGRKVIEETYVIAADCCHIQKVKGRDVVGL